MSSIIKVNEIQDGGGNTIIKTDGSGNISNNKLLTPAFEAYLSATQSLADNTNTKAQFDTEVFDTDNCYDNSTNYRFTPTVAGKYFVYAKTRVQSGGNTELKTAGCFIYKNGSSYMKTHTLFWNSYIRAHAQMTSAVVDMNGSTDYIEIFGYADVTSGTPDGIIGGSDKDSIFGSYRIGD